MLKYAIILLDKTAAAFCHADNHNIVAESISVDILSKAICWAMKENLSIQFVYPDNELSQELIEAIEATDHIDIRHNALADVIICNSIQELEALPYTENAIVLRITKDEFMSNVVSIVKISPRYSHLSLVFTNLEKMSVNDFNVYRDKLTELSLLVKEEFVKGNVPKINLITDRMQLEAMNNCNAGWESITIAPNGKFYICPAFYFSNESNDVGSLETGLNIPNPQLYRLDHAPICRICDAYQCRRCIWLNLKLTREVNTPSHQQCVVAHLERNASRTLLQSVRELGEFLPGNEIPILDYIDPFEKIIKQ